MPTRKLNSMPDYQARMPKTPHDVSRSLSFTTAPAIISPVFVRPLHHGSRVKFTPRMFARLNPVYVPFIGDIDVHIDTFFVPLTVMYTPSMSLFYQTDDLLSSSFQKGRMDVSKFPSINLNGLISTVRADVAQGGYTFSSYPYRASFGSESIDYNPNIWDCAMKSFMRMADFLDYNPSPVFAPDGASAMWNPVHTPWFALAYQAVYQLYDRYRNSDREGKNYAYNIDQYYTGSIPTQDASVFHDIFTLRYAEQYKDYFNSIKVSPIASSVSMLRPSGSPDQEVRNESMKLLTRINSYLHEGSYARATANGASAAAGPILEGIPDSLAVDVAGLSKSATVVPSPDSNSFSAANIRQLFMVDKLLRVTGRADKTYESQFLAHFGVKVPHDVLHNITHVSHDVGTLRTSSVISTANTWNGETGSSLGEIGGQGQVSFSGHTKTFEAPCPGVFLCNVTFMPRFRYFAGFSKLHDLSSPDKWWQPEFDKIGMQPLFAYEAFFETPTGSPSVFNARRFGWQFGYEQFKRSYDKVTSAFKIPPTSNTVNTYGPWVLSKYPFTHFMKDGSLYKDDLTQSTSPINLTTFKGAPTDLNGVMQVLYDTGWSDDITWENYHLLFQTDPFLCDFTMFCKELNFMSEYSEPELG